MLRKHSTVALNVERISRKPKYLPSPPFSRTRLQEQKVNTERIRKERRVFSNLAFKLRRCLCFTVEYCCLQRHIYFQSPMLALFYSSTNDIPDELIYGKGYKWQRRRRQSVCSVFYFRPVFIDLCQPQSYREALAQRE